MDPSGLNDRKGTLLYSLQIIKVLSDDLLTQTETTRFSTAVYVYLACAFRYGSDDLDVIGLSFRRDIWLRRVQVYPPTGGSEAKSPMMESLLKKVGEQGHTFSFQVQTLNLSLCVTTNKLFSMQGILIHLRSYPRFYLKIILKCNVHVCDSSRCHQIFHARFPYSLGQMIPARYSYHPALLFAFFKSYTLC